MKKTNNDAAINERLWNSFLWKRYIEKYAPIIKPPNSLKTDDTVVEPRNINGWNDNFVVKLGRKEINQHKHNTIGKKE